MKIELRCISLSYQDGRGPLEDVSLTVDPGSFVLIQGPSGSGKSSLLRLLNRLQEPTRGEIFVDDRPLTSYEPTKLRRRIGYVQQTPVMLDASVGSNLELPFHFAAARGAQVPTAERLRALLDDFLLREVGLDDDATKLSVGQKQRLALIRSLLTEPAVLLCDEPTSALDPESRGIVQASLERLNLERRMSVIVVTHLDFALERIDPVRYQLTRERGLERAKT